MSGGFVKVRGITLPVLRSFAIGGRSGFAVGGLEEDGEERVAISVSIDGEALTAAASPADAASIADQIGSVTAQLRGDLQ